MGDKIKNRFTGNKAALFLVGSLGAYLFLAVGMMLDIVSYYATGIIISILINIIMAVSLALVTGYLGELVLGHAGFMAVGAYTSAIITLNLQLPAYIEFPLALVLGGCLAALIGVLIGIPALRLKGDYLGIITLGFGEIIRIFLNNLKITNGAKGLTGISSYSNFTTTFLLAVVIIFIIYKFIQTRHGRSIIAIRENEIASECMGISTFYFKTLAFAIAAFFAGIAGGLYAHYYQVLNPQSFGFLYSIEYLIIVVLGGMGNLAGTIVAAIILGVLNETLRGFAEYRMLIYSVILILMMVYKAKGITLKSFIPSLNTLKNGKNKLVNDSKERVEEGQ